MNNSPGYKTTEFWLSMAAIIAGALTSSGVFTNSTVLQALALVSSALAAMGYSAGRSFAKGRIGAAETSAKIIAETALKKSLKSETVAFGSRGAAGGDKAGK